MHRSFLCVCTCCSILLTLFLLYVFMLVQYPTIYTRTSFHYKFLQTFICSNSVSAPEYLSCEDAGTFSPGPTPTPGVAPVTSSPVTSGPTRTPPTPPPVVVGMEQLVTVFIRFDRLPVQTGYTIVDGNGNTVIFEPPGTFGAFIGESYTDTFALTSGETYLFAMRDSGEDGICCGGFGAIYLGDTVADDQVLAFVEGTSFSDLSMAQSFVLSPDSTFTATFSPTSSPSLSAAPSLSAQPTVTQVTVTVAILLDDFPFEVGWAIVDAQTQESVEFLDPGNYQTFQANTMVNATFSLNANEVYAFFLFDVGNDGFAGTNNDGFGAVYLGDEIRSDMLLAYLPASFEFLTSSLFQASEQGLITLSPTAAPSMGVPVNITVVVNFDTLATETGWSIGETVTRRPIFDQPIGTYGFELFNSQIQQQVELLPNTEYILVVLDSRGDGMCCQFGQGNITVYLGTDTTSPDAQVLAFDDGQFTFNRATTFFVPDIVVPTAAPVTTAPAGFPTPPACNICGDASLSVGAPDAFVPEAGVTCGELEAIGQVGGILADACTTVVPTIIGPCMCTTASQDTAAPITPAPVTPAPVTPAPVTPAPVTPAPVTPAPVTPAPITPAPVTAAPIVPATPAPVTGAPVTPAPVTPAPVTPAPVTDAPVVVEATPMPVAPGPPPSKAVPTNSPAYLPPFFTRATPSPTPTPTTQPRKGKGKKIKMKKKTMMKGRN